MGGIERRQGHLEVKACIDFENTFLGQRFGSDSFQLFVSGNNFISMGFHFLCKMEGITVPTYHRVVVRTEYV